MSGSSLEIERKFLLRSKPAIPDGAVVWCIEQGYLSSLPAAEQVPFDGLKSGRLRRVTLPEGAVMYTHTVKHGVGLVRQEVEQELERETFERAWPRTAGRRLSKTRYRVREGPLTWEIDVFDGIDLVLAEVELPTAETPSPIPGWLAPVVDREVTNEPGYTNAAIASRLAAV